MNSRISIVPSIASSNLANIEEEIRRIGNNYDNLHIDIEDGNFVPNITFGIGMIKAIRSITSKPFSVHLMVSDPAIYLDDLLKLNCSHIFIHVENQQYIRPFLYKIRQAKVKAGIALNPISNIGNYEYLLDDVDSIMYMTSEPDGRNQQFNPNILNKLKIFPRIETWVDGGVKTDVLDVLQQKGVSTVVLGREIFNHQNPEKLLSEINT